jgi:hypothetical protein
MHPEPAEPNDENIRQLAFRLDRLACYIERYPRPSSLTKFLGEIKFLVAALEQIEDYDIAPLASGGDHAELSERTE